MSQDDKKQTPGPVETEKKDTPMISPAMLPTDTAKVTGNGHLPQILAASLSLGGLFVGGTADKPQQAPKQSSQPADMQFDPAIMMGLLNRALAEQRCKKITTKTDDPLPPIDAPISKPTKPMMIIPAGTQVCPERRCAINQEQFYITLDKSIEIYLDGVDTIVSINGTMFHVIDSSRYDDKQRANAVADGGAVIPDRKKLQSFVVPKGTPYYVNDNVKDPVGLLHSFDADERVRIRQESSVYLPEGTEIVMFDNAFIAKQEQNGEKTLPNDVHMILKNRTKCTV